MGDLVKITMPTILETSLTGWRFTLSTDYRGKKYSARYQSQMVTVSRDGAATDAAQIPQVVIRRFNKMHSALSTPIA